MSRSDTEAAWQAVWFNRGWRARLLWPLSLFYGFLSGLRRWRYARNARAVTRLPVPVIVVGNVVVGGAGKTPTVLALLDHLKSAGWHAGVVSRGHGRRGHGSLELLPDTPPADAGDEPTLIRRRADVPVFVGRRRADAALALLRAHPEVDVLLCDDGLQHLALGRDVAITVFDDRGLGNGWLLPAGLLREPWPPSANDPFAPQMVLLLSRKPEPGSRSGVSVPAGRMESFHGFRQLAETALGPDGQRRPLDALSASPVVAVAGIARPQAFFDMLRKRGLHLSDAIALPDHASEAAFEVLPRSSATTVVCTEKDAVKLMRVVAGWPESERPAVWAVPLELFVEPAFFAALDSKLNTLAQGARLSSADGHQTA